MTTPPSRVSTGAVILWNYAYLIVVTAIFFFSANTTQLSFEIYLWMLGLQALANLLLSFLPGSSRVGHIVSIFLMPLSLILIGFGFCFVIMR